MHAMTSSTVADHEACHARRPAVKRKIEIVSYQEDFSRPSSSLSEHTRARSAVGFVDASFGSCPILPASSPRHTFIMSRPVTMTMTSRRVVVSAT